MKKTTFITRTKNKPLFLQRSIQSVLGQSSPHWDMVIVNDGGDTKLVDTLARRYEQDMNGRLKVIHNPDTLGVAQSNNIGIQASDSDYILIHEDSGFLAPDFLTTMVPLLEKEHQENSSTQGILAKANNIKERCTGNRIIIKGIVPSIYGDIKTEVVALDQLLQHRLFAPIQFLYQRSALAKIGLYNEDLLTLEDWDFALRFILQLDVFVAPYYLAFTHHDDDAKSDNEDFASSKQYVLTKNKALRSLLPSAAS